jgi:hypothetical protein
VDPPNEPRQGRTSQLSAHPDGNRKASRPKTLKPVTVNAHVGILDCRNHPDHAGGYQGIGARRSFTMMGTGLERDIGR